MMIEQHYDDEILVVFLQDESAARRDAHLSDCPTCRHTLQTLRHLAGTLQSDAVWETRELSETPRQSTVDFLRAKQAELEGEDAEATVKRLIAHPREQWREIVQSGKWSAKIAVDALVAEAERTVFANPPDALILAQIATGISAGVEDAISRSAAWREYGFCLYFTGRYQEALEATNRSTVELADVSRVESGRILIQRALIMGDIGKHSESRVFAREAADLFLETGDVARYVGARRTEAIALYKERRYRDAIHVYESVHRLAEDLGGGALAGLLQNLALCHRELGQYDQAIKFFLLALDSFECLGQLAHIARTRWYLGRLLMTQGRYADALQQLRSVETSFREMSMIQDVALVTIDIAQVLVLTGDMANVVGLCRNACEYFAQYGLTQTEGALTALALIREAASGDQLSQALLLDTRVGLERRTSPLSAAVAE
jgi:tetratricopeptide (TPR) repeat protein